METPIFVFGLTITQFQLSHIIMTTFHRFILAAHLATILFVSSASAFTRGMKETGLVKWQFSKTGQNWEEVTIPHSCNAIDGHSEKYHRGLAYYKTSVSFCKKELSLPHFLLFEGAAQAADVYVNGYLLTKHLGGYTPFTLAINPWIHEGDNEIQVVCDNHENVNLIPVASDFNKNNGLHNPVYLLTMNPGYFSPLKYGMYRLHVTTPKVSEKEAFTCIESEISNASSHKERYTIHISLANSAGKEVYTATEKITIAAGQKAEFRHGFKLDSPHLWNGVQDPYLYTLSLTLKDAKGKVLDLADTKVGYRFYEMTRDNGFFLNGKPYLLRGVALHQDMEDKASALSTEDFINDYKTIHEIGANFVRLAHYPHRDIAFRICDSMGLVVQTEIPWVNVCGEYATTAYFDNITHQMDEMMNNLYNHPSIIFWGMWNEVHNWGNKPWFQGKLSTEKLLGHTQSLYKHSKKRDPFRYIGLTECSIFKYKDYHKLVADYYSENRYNGWYYHTFKFNVFTENMNEIHNKMGICNVAEYGGGTNPFCHTTDSTLMANRKDDTRHYEEYGNLIHESHVRQIQKLPYLNFTSLWILFDFPVANRTEGYMDSEDGIHFTENNYRKYINDKGLVTRDRKTKKDVFYLYKSWWNKKETTVHITSKRMRIFPSGKPVTVKIYSNARSLKLYQNGKLIQTLDKCKDESGIIWTFEPVRNESSHDVFKVVADDSTEDTVDWHFN